VILASARSGSKLLRDILLSSPECCGKRFDLNYIWKYGNHHIPHDELSPQDLHQTSARFIQDYFEKIGIGTNSKLLVEKTVSNSLRPEFVRRVFPDAKYIVLIRDGRAVTESLLSCWENPKKYTGGQSISLLLEKLLNFPFESSLPYLIKYCKTTAMALIGGEKIKSWGPRFDGMDEMVQKTDLVNVCAQQWLSSIVRTQSFLDADNGESSIIVRYEDLVSNTDEELDRIIDFIGIDDRNAIKKFANKVVVNTVSQSSAEKYTNLSVESLGLLERGLRLTGYLK